MLFGDENLKNKKEQLKQEISEIKEDINSKNKDLNALKESISNKKLELQSLYKEQEMLKSEIEDLKRFVKSNSTSISEDLNGNFDKYISASIKSMSISKEEYGEKHFCYINLEITNNMMYQISAIKLKVNFENLFGDVLAERFPFESSISIGIGQTKTITQNYCIRWTDSYSSSFTASYFKKPYDLENIINDYGPKNVSEKIMLKIMDLELVINDDGDKRKIHVDRTIKDELKPKKPDKKPTITKTVKEEKSIIYEDTIKEIKFKKVPEINKKREHLIQKKDVILNDSEIDEKRLKQIKKYLKKSRVDYYVPVRYGASIITNSYTIFSLNTSYLKDIPVHIPKSWSSNDIKKYFEKFDVSNDLILTEGLEEEKIANLVLSGFAELSDIVTFSKEKIKEAITNKEPIITFTSNNKKKKRNYDPKFLKDVIDILGIEEDEFIGECDESRKTIITNKEDIAVILEIIKY